MVSPGDAQASMLVQFTDIDQDGAAINQRFCLRGGDLGKGHGALLWRCEVEGVEVQNKRCSSAINCSMRGSLMRYQRVWLSRLKLTMFSSRILARCCDSADWLRPTASTTDPTVLSLASTC